MCVAVPSGTGVVVPEKGVGREKAGVENFDPATTVMAEETVTVNGVPSGLVPVEMINDVITEGVMKLGHTVVKTDPSGFVPVDVTEVVKTGGVSTAGTVTVAVPTEVTGTPPWTKSC